MNESNTQRIFFFCFLVVAADFTTLKAYDETERGCEWQGAEAKYSDADV